MLSNLLRIFITKQAINTMHEESAKQLAQLEQIQEQHITQITNREEFEAFMKHREEERKERVLYQYRPILAMETMANISALFPMFLVLGILVILGSVILMFLGFMGKTEQKYFFLGVCLILIIIALLWFSKYYQHYLENTRILFYDNKICIKKYRKEDIVISYEEVKKCVKKKKIQIYKGGLAIPYLKGRFHVVVGKTVLPQSFLEFIAKKCETEIPMGDKAVLAIIKSGYGYSWYGVGALFFIGLSLFISILTTVGDYGLEHSVQEVLHYFISTMFAKTNVFTIAGALCVVIGVILKIVYYFPVKKHFKHCKDIVVSLFVL